MKKCIYVFMGGGVGASIRSFAAGSMDLEWGGEIITAILLINLSGAFLIGFFMSGPGRHPVVSREWRLFAATGVLGGMTSFSALSMEAGMLLLDGNAAGMLCYLGLSLGLGLAAVFLGHFFGERTATRFGLSHLPLANGMERRDRLQEAGDA